MFLLNGLANDRKVKEGSGSNETSRSNHLPNMRTQRLGVPTVLSASCFPLYLSLQFPLKARVTEWESENKIIKC